MATITLYELSAYNAGKLIPQTFDLDSIDTQDEWHTSVQDWLRSLTKQTGQLCEEWIVADYDDVPQGFVGEWDIDKAYWGFKEAVQASHLEEGVFRAAMALDIAPEMVEELYQGQYDTDEDFAFQMADDLGLVPQTNEWPTSYIDWTAAARDLMLDYGVVDGHYFRTSY